MLTETEAAASVRDAVPGLGAARFVASPRGELLWSVGALDEQDRPLAGGGWLVGPDGRVWSLSSNPGIHDWDLAARLLERLYAEGLAARVDADCFSDRLATLTSARQEAEDELLRDARGGALRRTERRLP